MLLIVIFVMMKKMVCWKIINGVFLSFGFLPFWWGLDGDFFRKLREFGWFLIGERSQIT
jgi:hypothetical protein